MERPQGLASLARLWRYYQAGIVNTLFGYGLYALFVAVGLNMYVAQICAHILGMTFNYFTYSRYAFRDAEGSKLRFVLSYAANYLLGLASLAAAAQVIASPYLAGLAAVLFVSMVNYFILKHFVFTRRVA
jgi:putative flippase GtrA